MLKVKAFPVSPSGALDTGLRKGELRILNSDWVTWSANELRIRQPKVKRVKVIPLTPRTRAILARCRAFEPRLGEPLSVGVGLRPGRDEIRVERERLDRRARARASRSRSACCI